MSKAFTRESDDAPEEEISWMRPALPPGVKNYMTSDGAARLREELRRWVEVERPALMKQGPAATLELKRLEQRIRRLEESLQSAVVVEPPAEQDRVRFGSTVTVRAEAGEESVYRIVGLDETDIDRGWISWLSPLAKALTGRRAGEQVRFRFPSGEQELLIVQVSCRVTS